MFPRESYSHLVGTKAPDAGESQFGYRVSCTYRPFPQPSGHLLYDTTERHL